MLVLWGLEGFIKGEYWGVEMFLLRIDTFGKGKVNVSCERVVCKDP